MLGTRKDRAKREGPGEEQHTQRLGLAVQDVDPRMLDRRGGPEAGAVIVGVSPGSPAEVAGLSPGMVVVEVGGKPVKRARELVNALGEAKSGQSVLLRVATRAGTALRAVRIP
jgi:S1-C subfamily serine protease